MSALAPIKIYRGTPQQVLMPGSIASVASVYTVPSGKQLILKHVRVTSIDDTDPAAFYLKTGTSATASNGDYVLYNTRVEPFDTFLFETNEVLEAGDKIYVWLDQLGLAAVQISGIEVTL
jgi:hypothetical protein